MLMLLLQIALRFGTIVGVVDMRWQLVGQLVNVRGCNDWHCRHQECFWDLWNQGKTMGGKQMIRLLTLLVWGLECGSITTFFFF
jgi:hypothetical protein